MTSLVERPGATTTEAAGAEVEQMRVAIIGSGFSGLGMAIRLKQAGIDDFVVLERAAELGGTWRDNSYPGCACDIPSHVYSFSFELNPDWTHGFASQPEILAYLRRTSDKYGVTPHIRFEHEVTEARWEDDAQRWSVLAGGRRFSAQFLVAGAGPLSDPLIPGLPGLHSFTGTVFHSARWRHDHDLRGKRVAAIGTGASAIQFVPRIQPLAGKLHLFQRTPAWVIPRWDHEITPVEKKLLRRIPLAPRLVRAALYWALELRVLGFRNPAVMRAAGRLAHTHLLRQVKDPALRAKLTPDYTMGCKRILISDDYYPALTQPNVEVITDGVAEVRPHSVVTTAGEEREVDTIIFGTGFHVTDSPIAARIHGRDGRSLEETWQGSMQAYLGTTIAGFPNLFFLVGPNTGLGHNSIIFMIESQVRYILGCLAAVDRYDAASVEVRADVQASFNDEVQAAMRGTVWTDGHCSSYYLDRNGRNSSLWPGWTFRFRARTRRFDASKYRWRRVRARSATAP